MATPVTGRPSIYRTIGTQPACADNKFAPFKKTEPEFVGVLVIVYDDFVSEPLTAPVAPTSGLFTPNSLARDAAGLALTFANVDGVVTVRHLHEFRAAAADQPPVDRRDGLDYGRPWEFPFKVFSGKSARRPSSLNCA